MTTEITKAHLTKNKKGEGLTLHVTKTSNGDEISGIEIHKAIIHKDLKLAFDGLKIHLAVMVGYISPHAVEIANVNPDVTENFHVKGYSIGGDDDTSGVIISGHLILKNGMAHNFNTPFYRFEQNEQSRYIFMDDLQVKLKAIEQEISKYLSGEKRGEPVQPELFDQETAPVVKMEKKPANPRRLKQTAENPSGAVIQ